MSFTISKNVEHNNNNNNNNNNNKNRRVRVGWGGGGGNQLKADKLGAYFYIGEDSPRDVKIH